MSTFVSYLKLSNPYTMLIAGQTGCGKTHFVYKLLKVQSEMHENPFERIIYVYSVEQSIYSDMLSSIENIEFYEGLPR